MAVRDAQRRERRGTAAEWAAVNPILKAGELGILQDGDGRVQEIRVGDGTSAWADLGDTALLPKSVLTATYAALVDGKVDPDQLPDIDALPAGGDTGDALVKASGDDGDAEWVDLSGIYVPLSAVIDEDDMSSDSDQHVPTQQSVKTYVDALDSGALVKLASVALSGAGVSFDNIPSGYAYYRLAVIRAYASAVATMALRFNGETGGSAYRAGSSTTDAAAKIAMRDSADRLGDYLFVVFGGSASRRIVGATSLAVVDNNQTVIAMADTTSCTGYLISPAALSSIDLDLSTGTFAGGTAILYGVTE